MTSSPIAVPTSSSTPLDASKLNHTPATLSTLPVDPSTTNTSAALRSPEESSPYLDAPTPEQPSHPTVAETGLSMSPGKEPGPGPKSGQLRRVSGGEKKEDEVIHLGSFGGDGLKAKPPGPVGVQPKSPEIATFDVAA